MNSPLPSCHFPDIGVSGPRFREAGDLTLDLFHRDGRVDAQWLGLSPREFALLWRLAAQPGERLGAHCLRAEVWWGALGPEGEGIAAQVARARAKLASAGLAQLLATDAEGRYFLDLPPAAGWLRRA